MEEKPRNRIVNTSFNVQQVSRKHRPSLYPHQQQLADYILDGHLPKNVKNVMSLHPHGGKTLYLVDEGHYVKYAVSDKQRFMSKYMRPARMLEIVRIVGNFIRGLL